ACHHDRRPSTRARHVRAAAMPAPDLEVVWPKHRWHYLSPDLIDMSSIAENDDGTDSMQPATGRDLAARALVAGAGCTQQRAAELLETSRRSVGRAVDTDVVAALQHPRGDRGSHRPGRERASRQYRTPIASDVSGAVLQRVAFPCRAMRVVSVVLNRAA